MTAASTLVGDDLRHGAASTGSWRWWRWRSPVRSWSLSRLYRRGCVQQSREVRSSRARALSVVQEVLGALRVVKAFGQEDREHERFVAPLDREGMWARIRLRVASRAASASSSA